MTIEPQPVFLEKYLPRSWRVPAGKLLPLGRLLGRLTSLGHLWRMLALLGAYSLTGSAFQGVYLLSRGDSFTKGELNGLQAGVTGHVNLTKKIDGWTWLPSGARDASNWT